MLGNDGIAVALVVVVV